MHRKWVVKRTNPEYISYISRSSSVSPAFAQILINRGLKNPQEIDDFLNPQISAISDPFELHGLKTAVERIKYAISRNEKVLIHGDYDADGLTATSIMVQTLRMLGLDVHYFIPDRIKHGYGFNPASVRIAKELGVSLIITVDCGITSFEAASYAKQQEIDVIITDHHEPVISDESQVTSHKRKDLELVTRHSSLVTQYLLPEAIAIINPKLLTSNSQLSTLSGAGIAFKIAQALGSELQTPNAELLLDLAALGTLADVVPLTGENRVIVREGLRLIQEGQRPGINSLKKVAGLDKRALRSELLSFTLIPRINASGRIAHSSDVVRLLLSDKEDEALQLSIWLDKLNSERQKIEEEVYQEALLMIDTDGIDSVIVLSGDGWHQGVVGIVASRLAEEFNRPTFILAVEEGIAKGSARSIPSFDIFKGLSECRELLLSCGGHKQAAGVRLKADNIPAFKSAMQRVIKRFLTENDFIPILEIDADITLSQATPSLVKEISMLEPFGHGNEEPFLGCKSLEVMYPRIVGNNHLKMRLRQGGYSVDAIGFDMGSPNPPSIIDAVFTPTINEWEGGTSLQLNLKAFRPSQ